MKKFILILTLIVSSYVSNGQTNLVSNNGFESNFTGWFTSIGSGSLWSGIGACSAAAGNRHCWFADQNQTTGWNDSIDDIYQTVTIPTNLAGCQLTFSASINTQETTTSSVWDSLNIRLRSSTGVLLHDFGYLSNLQGSFGIPGCQTWVSYNSPNLVPTSLYGQTVRLSFEFNNDVSNPTIFRIDEVALTAYPACVYSLSNSTYNCPNGNAGTYSNVSSVTAQNWCIWTASVLTGNSWLTCTSTDTGNGNVAISVTQNVGPARTGTIDIEGQILTITQPSACTYSLSQNSYTAPDHTANTYNNIAGITTLSACPWTATVTSGASWLSTSSSGTGNGSLSISMTSNPGAQRSGTIDIEGQIITIIQPEEVICTYSLSTSSYTLPNSNAGTQTSIVLVNTQSNCSWSAQVTPSSTWLSCSSTGNGSGAIDIVVLANSTSSLRTATIDVEGEILTVIQPPKGVTNGISEINAESLRIYPSPATDNLTISLSLSDGQTTTYQVIDQSGKTIVTEEINSEITKVDVSTLSTGLYFIRIGSGQITKKFIKE